MLTEAQVVALEKAKVDKEAHGEFESECPGYCVAQDTFYVGTLKGVGRIYQQTLIDTYCKVGFAKLYDRKTPLTAADLLNDRVVPFFEEHEIAVSRVLTDRGTEYCGKPERHEYELYLAVENIDHTRTKAKSPQTNGICERFHKTMLDEFYRVAFRKKLYRRIDELQADLDAWLVEYNEERPHQGRWCYGKTPMQTFIDSCRWRRRRCWRREPERTTTMNRTPRTARPSVRSGTDFHTCARTETSMVLAARAAWSTRRSRAVPDLALMYEPLQAHRRGRSSYRPPASVARACRPRRTRAVRARRRTGAMPDRPRS